MKVTFSLFALLLLLVVGVPSALASAGLDADGDGVPYRHDHCPYEFGLVTNHGCPLGWKEPGREVPPEGAVDFLSDSGGDDPVADDVDWWSKVLRSNCGGTWFVDFETNEDGERVVVNANCGNPPAS